MVIPTALQANGNEGNKVWLSMKPSKPLILSDMRSGRHAAAPLPAGTRDLSVLAILQI